MSATWGRDSVNREHLYPDAALRPDRVLDASGCWLRALPLPIKIKRALEPRERDAAKERQREHGGTAPGRHHTVEKFSGVNGGRALDRIARVVGKHRTAHHDRPCRKE